MKRDDITIELVISELLRWGVRTSLFLMVLGTAICLGTGEYNALGNGEGLRTLTSDAAGFPTTLSALASGLIHLRGMALIVLGLALLVITPMLRVVASVVAFAIQKDRAYTLISLIVLLLVAMSFALGSVG